MSEKTLQEKLIEAQNHNDWREARTIIIGLMKECAEPDQLQDLLEEIQNRDWFFNK